MQQTPLLSFFFNDSIIMGCNIPRDPRPQFPLSFPISVLTSFEEKKWDVFIACFPYII